MTVATLAKQLGFHRAAVVPVEPARRNALSTSWLAAGMAADMAYLATPEHVTPRADVRGVLAQARSLVVVALSYERSDPVPAAALVRGRDRTFDGENAETRHEGTAGGCELNPFQRMVVERWQQARGETEPNLASGGWDENQPVARYPGCVDRQRER